MLKVKRGGREGENGKFKTYCGLFCLISYLFCSFPSLCSLCI